MLTLLEYRYDVTSIASEIHRIQQSFCTNAKFKSSFFLIFLLLILKNNQGFKYLVRIPDICVKMQIFNRLLEKGVSITFCVCVLLHEFLLGLPTFYLFNITCPCKLKSIFIFYFEYKHIFIILILVTSTCFVLQTISAQYIYLIKKIFFQT